MMQKVLGAPRTPSFRPRILLAWLLALTFYRIWLVPHLGITLYVDEAQYWTWAQQLDWGYYSKPPVIAWLIAASTALFGDGVVAVKLAGILLYPACAWLSFVLGKELYDERIALRCALSVSLLPFVSGLGLFVSTDAPLLFFWLLGMLALRRALVYDRWSDWLLLAAALGLGVLSKYTMLAFAACAALYLLLDKGRRQQLGNPRLWVAIGVAALIVMPNIIWNWQHDFPTLHHTADITHVEGANSKHGNADEFLVAQAVSLGPLIALAYLVSLTLLWRKRRDTRQQLLHCFSLPLFGIVLLQALRSEANGNWAAPALIPAAMLAVVWLSRLRARWWLAAIGLNALLMLAVYHVGDVYRLRGVAMPAKFDILKRARGWDSLAKQLRPLLVQYPDAIILANNRTLIAHMSYELRDLNLRFAAWKPQERAQDHYQLTIPLDNEDMGRSALLLTQTDAAAIAEHFAAQEKIARITVQSPSVRRELDVLLLQGFRGYR
jgi:4-amino-4-deoxy-L-arabinose transferase-like glycosyltransferase